MINLKYFNDNDSKLLACTEIAFEKAGDTLDYLANASHLPVSFKYGLVDEQVTNSANVSNSELNIALAIAVAELTDKGNAITNRVVISPRTSLDRDEGFIFKHESDKFVASIKIPEHHIKYFVDRFDKLKDILPKLIKQGFKYEEVVQYIANI